MSYAAHASASLLAQVTDETKPYTERLALLAEALEAARRSGRREVLSDLKEAARGR